MESREFLKSFADQHPPAPIGPVTAQYFSLDLAGWTDNTRCVETHFFVEFAAEIDEARIFRKLKWLAKLEQIS